MGNPQKKTCVVLFMAGLSTLGACANRAAVDTTDDESSLGSALFIPFVIGDESNLGTNHAALTEFEPPGLTPQTDSTNSGRFYLAIRRDTLGKRFMFSAFLKSYRSTSTPGTLASDPVSLGSSVVSLKVQNGKVYLLDSSSNLDTGDGANIAASVLLDAFPIVEDYSPFQRAAGADKYILIDPRGGANHWTLNSEQVDVTDSFAQGFKRVRGGIGFEKVFTGLGTDKSAVDTVARGEFQSPNELQRFGTLALTLRQYEEAEGFVPTTTDHPNYFKAQGQAVPSLSGISLKQEKWAIRKGMAPIIWRISPEFYNVQAKNPHIDLIGAIKRGVESWNEVFGFNALQAVDGGPDTDLTDDRSNVIFLMGTVTSSAYASNRYNPNTGEIFGATIGIHAGLLSTFTVKTDRPPRAPDVPAPPPHWEFRWDGVHGDGIWEPELPPPSHAPLPNPAPNPSADADALQRFVAHEVGHTLGLRHNFMGSLDTKSPSIMDYYSDVIGGPNPNPIKPGAYDRDAIAYLYGISKDLPKQPFCNDDGVAAVAECNRFDGIGDPAALLGLPEFAEACKACSTTDPTERAACAPNLSAAANAFLQKGGFATGQWPAIYKYFQTWNVPAHGAFINPLPFCIISEEVTSIDSGISAFLFLNSFTSENLKSVDKLKLRLVGDTNPDPMIEKLSVVAALVVAGAFGDKGLPSVIASMNFRIRMLDTLKELQDPRALQAILEAKNLLSASVPALTGFAKIDAEDLLRRIEQALNPYYHG